MLLTIEIDLVLNMHADLKKYSREHYIWIRKNKLLTKIKVSILFTHIVFASHIPCK